MQAGRLTERVRFDREIRAPDGGGGAATSWEEVFTKWARVDPLRGREQLEAMKLQASNLYRVTLRNDYAVDAAWRIVWLTGGLLVLNIREMPPTSPREFARFLIVEAGVAV